MKQLLLIMLLAFIFCFGCNHNEDNCGCGPRYLDLEPDLASLTPPFPGAWAELVANIDPISGGTAKLTFRYEFQLSQEECESLILIAHGSFDRSIPDIFTYVSGESSWVDTVSCYERVEHSVVIRAFRKGELLIQAYVAAEVDSYWHPGGTDLVCLCVK